MSFYFSFSLTLILTFLTKINSNPAPNPSPLFGISIGRLQSSGVEGYLTCEGKPAANVLVKLYDDDRGIDADDLMAKGFTDKKGYFKLEGHTHEITDIDPKLNVYHDCNDGMTPCQRKISIMIPDKYITAGKKPDKYYDAGTIELEGKFKGEERDCIH
uniref:Transthyretin-like protein 5 n=1 Tax=Meloidogyne incognita TaxID=6306 RepID=A0A914NLH8_MELIC